MSELTPEATMLLEEVVASARLEGHELPPEDLELAREYLAGEVTAEVFEREVRQLVDKVRRPAQSA